MLRIAVGTLALWLLAAAALRLTVLHAEVCPPLTAGEAHEAAMAAGDWIARNQLPDGSYVYEYDRQTERLSSAYNIVRHAGVTMSLYQLVRAGEEAYLAPADRGLAYMEASLLQGDDWVAFRQPGGSRVSLGANALLLAGLAQRRLATGDPLHDPLMRAVARFVLVMQRSDGSFPSEWDPVAAAPVPELTSRYATGESFWALALMHRIFPDEGWDGPALLTGRYLAASRDDAEGLDFPPWADQWAAYGFAELGSMAIGRVEEAYVRALAARFGFLVRVEARRGESRLSELLQGRRARAAGLGTWVEGLGSLWSLSRNSGTLSGLMDDIGTRGVCAAGMLADRQVDDAGSGQDTELLKGAWFTNEATRMDDQQHALSGLLLAEQILRSKE